MVFSTNTWRYRMTVTVETPEGIRTGSAVREVKNYGGIPLFPQASSPQITVKGEAVVVDLGKRGLLFSLVDGDYGAGILFKLFPEKEKRGKVVLKPEQYPNFVRFRDINAPRTAENVRVPEEKIRFKREDPRRPVVTFEEAFGAGVSIKEVTMEITGDPVTPFDVERYLPWLASVRMNYITGLNIDGPEWYQRLTGGDFERQ